MATNKISANAVTETQIFSFGENASLRVQVIDNEPWFVAKDVCDVLGIVNHKDAVSRLDNDEKRGVGITDPIGRQQIANAVSESGLYSLIFQSRKPSAKSFRKWVTSEVLPSIRKTGGYNTPQTPEERKRLTKTRIRAALTWVKGVSEVMNLSPASRLELLRQVADGAATPLPHHVPANHILRSATDLLRDNGAKINTIEFNRLLVQHGYLEVLTRRASHGAVKSFKHITDKGLEFGENRMNPKYPTATQPLWYVDRFPELLDAVNAAADETPSLQFLTAATNNECTAAPEVHNHNTIMNRPTICFVD